LGFFVNCPTRTTSTANWDTYRLGRLLVLVELLKLVLHVEGLGGDAHEGLGLLFLVALRLLLLVDDAGRADDAVLALLPALLQGVLHGADEVAGGREALLPQELEPLGALRGRHPVQRVDCAEVTRDDLDEYVVRSHFTPSFRPA
jgi:hypothetical protein